VCDEPDDVGISRSRWRGHTAGARIGHRGQGESPRPPARRAWSAQVPDIADPERETFVAEVAAMMDRRKERIGERAAEHALPLAVNALGPGALLPAGPAGLAAPGQLDRRLLGAVRLRPLDRADRARAPQEGLLTGEPPGTTRSPPSARSMGPTCGPCRTGHCCTCATPTQSKPTTGPCTIPTGNASASSPPRWRTAGSGKRATERQRRLARAADAELCRRHLDQRFEPQLRRACASDRGPARGAHPDRGLVSCARNFAGYSCSSMRWPGPTLAR
jgi:hypothetical protein